MGSNILNNKMQSVSLIFSFLDFFNQNEFVQLIFLQNDKNINKQEREKKHTPQWPSVHHFQSTCLDAALDDRWQLERMLLSSGSRRLAMMQSGSAGIPVLCSA